MPFDVLPSMGLTTDAYERLTSFFATTPHRPSEEQWDAIRDLLDHLQRAADGDLNRAVYLSPIPAGTGKSQSLAAFAMTLMDNTAYADTGMVIFVNRIAEAKDMAEAIGPAYRNKLCVIVGEKNPEVLALGDHRSADEAQIVISTQAALKETLKVLGGDPFGSAMRFHYQGKRRAVVCWDESLAFNRPVTLDVDKALALVKAVGEQSKPAAAALVEWWQNITGGDQDLHDVPYFEGLGIDFSRLEDAVGGNDDLVAQVKALAVVSGNKGFITRHGAAVALITHYPEIPPSLMPVVVTDASARVNASYAQMASTVPVVWLKDAPKTYRNLSIRIVNMAASRSVYRDTKTTRGRDLLDMVVRYVETVPSGKDVLVVGYKGHFRMKGVEETNLHMALLNRLKPEDRSRLRYLTYGNHTATNDHKHVEHVLLLGLNFLPKSVGHAASGAALDFNLKDKHPTEAQIKHMERGMLMDATLQAVLRGNARTGDEGDCGRMEVVIPQSKQSGLSDDDYQCMFPGVVIVQDRDLMPKQPLKGRLKELAGIVATRLGTGETEMTNQSLYDEMGMSRKNFSDLVKKPAWQAFIAALGLRPQPLKGRAMGLRLVA